MHTHAPMWAIGGEAKPSPRMTEDGGTAPRAFDAGGPFQQPFPIAIVHPTKRTERSPMPDTHTIITVDQAAKIMRAALRDAIHRHSLWYLAQGVLMVVAGFVA